MTRAGRKTDAATTLLMVLLILTAVKLLLERLLALMLPHDLHQNTRLLLSMAQEALLIGLPALLMRRGRSARTGTMRLSIGLLLCAAVLGLAMRALATPLTQLWGNFLSAPDSQIAAADSAGKWCLQLLALAVLPAVLEEALFRGVMFRGFACAFEASGRANPLLWAAAVSAGVFGVLHVSGGSPAVPSDAVVLAQVVLKPVQAALFGFVMAGVFARSHNLWLACGLHAAFNALSEGPLFLASGYLPATYLTGSVADAVLLAVGSVLLVPAAVKAKAWLVAS